MDTVAAEAQTDSRIARVRSEIAVIVNRPESDRLVDRIMNVITREIRATHAARMEYTDYLADLTKMAIDALGAYDDIPALQALLDLEAPE